MADKGGPLKFCDLSRPLLIHSDFYLSSQVATGNNLLNFYSDRKHVIVHFSDTVPRHNNAKKLSRGRAVFALSARLLHKYPEA